MAIQIEVISDVVCPWCFIGKRRLEQALREQAAEPGAAPVNVRWRPFQLNPDLPEAGMARSEYVARKFGDRGAQVYERVAAVGRSVGIDFAFDRIVRQPNTASAHVLIALAEAGGRQDAMVERLFQAYFLEGADLTRPEVLIDLAADAGLDRVAAAAALDDRDLRWRVSNDEQAARALGVEGVPFFVFDRRLAVSGAQEAAVLRQGMRQAATMVPTA